MGLFEWKKEQKLCLDGAFEEFSPTQMTLIGWKRGQISPRDDGAHLFGTLHFPSFQKMEPICLEHDIFPPLKRKWHWKLIVLFCFGWNLLLLPNIVSSFEVFSKKSRQKCPK